MDKQHLVHPCNGAVFSDKKKRASSHIDTWVILIAYCHCETNPSEKATYCKIPFLHIQEKNDTLDIVNKSLGATGLRKVLNFWCSGDC